MTCAPTSFSSQPSDKASTCHQHPMIALHTLRARLQHAFEVNISLFAALAQGSHMPSAPNSPSPHPMLKASACLQSQILALHTPRARLQHDMRAHFVLFTAFRQGFDMSSTPNDRSSHPSCKAPTCFRSQHLALRSPRTRLTHAFSTNFSIATSHVEGFGMPPKSKSCAPHPSCKAST